MFINNSCFLVNVILYFINCKKEYSIVIFVDVVRVLLCIFFLIMFVEIKNLFLFNGCLFIIKKKLISID